MASGNTQSILNKLETIIPLSFLLISGILFIPVFGINLSFNSGLYIHYLSFLILGMFFEIPELSLNLWCLIKTRYITGLTGESSTYKKIFAIRYFLTHFLAPTAGIMTISSGIYLILLGKDSLSEGWLFWLLCTSTMGLYKGVVQHRFFIKKIQILLQNPKERGNLHYYLQSPFDNLCIFSECPTYVFNFWLAWDKPKWLPNPFGNLIIHLEQGIHSRALVGVLIVVLGSLLTIPIRMMMGRFSRVNSI